MPESPLIQIETNSLNDLEALIADRAKREADIELGFGRRRDREKKEYQAEAQQLAGKFQLDDQTLKAEYARKRQEVAAVFQRDTKATEDAYAQAKQQADDQFKKEQRRAKKTKDEAGWQALAFFEGTRDEGVKWRRGTEANWSAAIQDLHVNQETAEVLLKRFGRMTVATDDESTRILADWEARIAAAPPPEAEALADPEATDPEAAAAAAAPAEDNPLTRLRTRLTRIEDEIIALNGLKLPKLAQISTLIWPFLILGGAIAAGLAIGANMGWTVGGVAGGVVAVAGTVGAWLGLSSMARPQVQGHAVPLRKLLADAEQEVEQNKEWVKNDFERKLKEFEERRANKVREAEETMARVVAEAEERRREAHKAADVKFPPLVEQVRQRRDEQNKKVEDVYPARIAARKEKYDADKKELDESYLKTRTATEDEYKRAWQSLIDDWTGGMGRIDEALRGVNEEAARRFLDWSRPELDGWTPPAEVPPGLRFGGFAVDLSQYPNGLPRDPRLKSVPTHFDLPALIPFPLQASTLIRAADGGKDHAITLLQALMLRFLTSVPPGKVRFTIIDPVGLGENFAAFMHLGDYHELLVTNRIWTEATHIEQRLTDLTEHMENVIQKYLRNEFETIEEYNTMAGEVAEPFRVVVVANFPTNFNDNALRRLVSIVNSGARCGVYALILLDTKLQLPSGFQLKDIEKECVNLIWKDNKLNWREPNLGKYPLALDAPPDQGLFSQILHRVGAAARDANRVEVPFEFIAPKPDQFWTFSSSKTVDIPLGRAGATKLQHLILGKGTSQHRADLGQDGLGQIDAAARPDHQRRPAVRPQRARVLPDRLQEGRRVQGLRVDGAAPRPGHRRRERARVRPERAPAAGRRDEGTRRDLPPVGLPGPQRLPRGPAGRPPHAPRAARDRRVPGVLRRGRQDRAGGLAAARPIGPAGPSLRHARVPRLTDPGRLVLAAEGHPGPDGGPHRAAVQRGRRPPDPQRGQHGRPAADPARRGDLQRRQRHGRGEQPLPGRLALG